MKTKVKILIALIILFTLLTSVVFAITEQNNGVMYIYTTRGGMEFSEVQGFDIKGYITDNEGEKTLISSTFGDDGYHTFLNVNGSHGVMEGAFEEEKEDLKVLLSGMQYNAYDAVNEWQNIDGIDLKVSTEFINNGQQLKIIYTLRNTMSEVARISLATTADVEIDEDDSATIERLEDGSGIRLWTKEGNTEKPVQFVLYARDVEGTTDVDNLWIGTWGWGAYMANMFTENPDVDKIEESDSAFTCSWTNRTIEAGETQTYSVLMEVGEINIPNTGLELEDKTKFYYKDVKINGTVIDEDLIDNIIVKYEVNGTGYELPEISTRGGSENFTIDLTNLYLPSGTEHSLKVWAVDSTECDSNVEERKFTVTYLKNPTLELSAPEWTNNDVTFRIVDEENEQQYVEAYQYRINNGEWNNSEKDTDILIDEDGLTQIDIRIIGTEPDDYSDIITGYAKIDRVNPKNEVPSAESTTCSITVHANQTDEHSGIDSTKTQYAIKTGDTWSEWQLEDTFNGLTHNTNYVVKTKSTDLAGNSSESEEFAINTKELLLGDLILKLNNNEGSDYTENTWTNQNIYVAINERIEGAVTKYYSKENSAQTISETNQETTIVEDGTTTILVSVTDGTNTITDDVEHILKVDKIAPVINELSLDSSEWTVTGKNVTGRAIDILSGINAYQFSNQNNITALSEGWNTLDVTNEEITESSRIDYDTCYFYVKDVAGNVTSVNINTKIDQVGPIITFVRSNGETAINVTDTGAGVASTKYFWSIEEIEPSESDWKEYEGAVVYDGTSKGIIYLWAIATDTLGNETIEYSRFSEIKKPTIITEGQFVNENASFKLTSNNEDTDVIYEFKINDGEWQVITKESLHTITDIKEGNITISARVLDNAGRHSDVETETLTVTIVEDEEPDTNKDNTVIDTDIPQTGEKNWVLLILVAVIIMAIVAYRKFLELKEI